MDKYGFDMLMNVKHKQSFQSNASKGESTKTSIEERVKDILSKYNRRIVRYLEQVDPVLVDDYLVELNAMLKNFIEKN